MSDPKNHRKSGASKSAGGRESREAGGASLIRGAAAGALAALAATFICALLFAAIGMRSDDPVRLAPIFGAVTLALASAAAGVFCARVGHMSPLLCAAAGAAITGAALLVSLIPALPETALIMPKALCAALPIPCAALGGRIASPRQRRRRRRRS